MDVRFSVLPLNACGSRDSLRAVWPSLGNPYTSRGKVSAARGCGGAMPWSEAQSGKEVAGAGASGST